MTDTQELADAIVEAQDRIDRAPGVSRGTRKINRWLRSDESRSVANVTPGGDETPEPRPKTSDEMDGFLRQQRGRMVGGPQRGPQTRREGAIPATNQAAGDWLRQQTGHAPPPPEPDADAQALIDAHREVVEANRALAETYK
jgi:hypothetical protein